MARDRSRLSCLHWTTKLKTVHPNDFLMGLLEQNSELVCRAVREQRASLKRPPTTAERFLDTFRRQGLAGVVDLLQQFPGRTVKTTGWPTEFWTVLDFLPILNKFPDFRRESGLREPMWLHHPCGHSGVLFRISLPVPCVRVLTAVILDR